MTASRPVFSVSSVSWPRPAAHVAQPVTAVIGSAVTTVSTCPPRLRSTSWRSSAVANAASSGEPLGCPGVAVTTGAGPGVGAAMGRDCADVGAGTGGDCAGGECAGGDAGGDFAGGDCADVEAVMAGECAAGLVMRLDLIASTPTGGVCLPASAIGFDVAGFGSTPFGQIS